MNNISNFTQRYKQAAWRVQRQWLGLFLLGIVLIAMVAGTYLSITARTALIGREIQMLEDDIANNQRLNADLETQLATLMSTKTMERRAEALGYYPVGPEDIMYIAVPGYSPGSSLTLASTSSQPAAPVILPEYTESLFDWMARKMQLSSPAEGDQR